MRRRWGGCATALLMLACNGSHDGAVETQLVPLSELACDAVLPPEAREAILPGSTAVTDRMCPTCGPLCVLRSQTAPETQVSLAYDCQVRYEHEDLAPLMARTLERGGFEVRALGRGAAQRAPAPGMQQVVAWDLDTPCAVVVTWLGPESERVVEATRAALSGLTRPFVIRNSRVSPAENPSE